MGMIIKREPRPVIYIKDVVSIMEKKKGAARNLMNRIRKSVNKTKTQFITTKEFIDFTGIPEETVVRIMNKYR